MKCPLGTDIKHAATLIAQGQLVAFPTETVYGLGANATDPTAVAKIFEAKQRPTFDPLIVHVANADAVEKLVTNIPNVARDLMQHFFPGSLSIVLPKSSLVPDLVTSGLPDVAVRCPNHPMALELIQQAGFPVAAPSANLFGKVSPTTALHVAEQLENRIDYILNGGACTIGLESTVVGFEEETGKLEILRLGGITIEELESFLKQPIAMTKNNRVEAAAPSPGMLKKHYAPTTPILLCNSPDTAKIKTNQNRQAIGLLSWQPLSNEVVKNQFAQVEILSETGDLNEAATNFFAALRRLDKAGLDQIFATPFPEIGLGRAMNDRLSRAVN